MKVSNEIHRSHCCQRHGCKYLDPDCPVLKGRVIQQGPCEMGDNLDGTRDPCSHPAAYKDPQTGHVYLVLGESRNKTGVLQVCLTQGIIEVSKEGLRHANVVELQEHEALQLAREYAEKRLV